jgi:uncharacterized protein involved in propanediol utilization
MKLENTSLFDGTVSVRNSVSAAAFKERVVGKHSAIGHCGELLQGVFYDSAGLLHRGLITLPCRNLKTTAAFSCDFSGVHESPPEKSKAAAAVQKTMEHFGVHTSGSELTLSSNIPNGLGMGSSTSDIVATIYAVAEAFGKHISQETVAKLAVETEIASDSIMFTESVVLFAQREGIILEHLGAQLPALTILSINTAPHQVVDTVSFPPARYSPWEKEAFRSLLAMARKAIVKGDVSLLGRVASASARINQRFLPKPKFAEIEAIAAHCGAVGVQVAHSGTIAGLMFDAKNTLVKESVGRASDQLAQLGMPPFMQFNTREMEMYYA